MNAWVYAHRLELILFVAALMVRLFLISIAPAQEVQTYWIGFDGDGYVNEAVNILAGHGFSQAYAPPYIPDTLKTPLYPLALAGVHLLFGSYIPILIFEAFLSSLIPIFAVRMAQFFIRRRSVLYTLGFFLVFEPHLMFSTIFFGTEGISVVLIAWGLYEVLAMIYKPKPYLHTGLAAVAFGLATLARPITYYLPVFFILLFAYQGYVVKRMREFTLAFVVFIAIFGLVLSPWIMRNFVVFGTPTMSTASWFNVYTRLAASVQAIDTGDDFYTSYHKLLDNLSLQGYIKHPPPVAEGEIEGPEFAPILRRESLRIMEQHPRALVIYLATVPFSVLTQSNLLGYVSSFVPLHYDHPSFSPTAYASHYGVVALIKAISPYLLGPYIVPYIVRTLLVILAVLACAGAWILWRKGDRFAALFLFGFITYLIVFTSSAGAQITDRHRAPFLAAEAVLAAVALERFIDKRQGKRSTLAS